MTTKVTIEAHCTEPKRVSVIISDNRKELDRAEKLKETFLLKDGEVAERFVYDDLEIFIQEIEHTPV